MILRKTTATEIYDWLSTEQQSYDHWMPQYTVFSKQSALNVLKCECPVCTYTAFHLFIAQDF